MDTLQVINHYFQSGRNEGRKSYYVCENGTVVFVAFNYSHIDNEITGYAPYIQLASKPNLLYIKPDINIFPEPLKNRLFTEMLSNRWSDFNEWNYKKDYNIKGTSKELFIDYILRNYELFMDKIQENISKIENTIQRKKNKSHLIIIT